MSCSAQQRRVRAYFAGSLPPAAAPGLRAHLRACRACADYYDRTAALEVALCGPGAPEPVARRGERLAEEILAGVAAKERPARRGWRWWGLRLAPAGAAAALVAVLWLNPRPPPLERAAEVQVGGEVWRVRGFAQTEQAAAGVGVRPFCVVAGGASGAGAPVVTEVRLAGTAAEVTRCPLDGVLVLLATNLLDTPRYATVFGLDPVLQPRWYYPKPDAASARLLPPGTLDLPMGRGIRLGVNHRPGLYRVIGLISARPVSVQALQSVLEGSRDRGAALDALGQLDLGQETVQVEFELWIEEGP